MCSNRSVAGAARALQTPPEPPVRLTRPIERPAIPTSAAGDALVGPPMHAGERAGGKWPTLDRSRGPSPPPFPAAVRSAAVASQPIARGVGFASDWPRRPEIDQTKRDKEEQDARQHREGRAPATATPSLQREPSDVRRSAFREGGRAGYLFCGRPHMPVLAEACDGPSDTQAGPPHRSWTD